jgi:curved DNA-binding protein
MKSFTVKIPAGIRNNEKIRLIGQGKKGEYGGKNGDLLIKINIAEDKKFRLEGLTIYTDLNITPWEAALGAKINIKGIDGEETVCIQQGIKSGDKIRIAGKGYKDGKGGRGDLVAEIKIMVPNKLSKEEIEIYEKLREVSNFNPR